VASLDEDWSQLDLWWTEVTAPSALDALENVNKVIRLIWPYLLDCQVVSTTMFPSDVRYARNLARRANPSA
jgi:hypothetical protein